MKTGDLVLLRLVRRSQPSKAVECIATLRLEPSQAYLDLPRDPLVRDTHHEISTEDLLAAVGRTQFTYRFTFPVPEEFWIGKH